MDYSKLASLYEDLVSTTKTLEKTEKITNFLKKVKSEELEDIVLLIEGRIFPEWDSTKIGVGRQTVKKAIALSAGRSDAEVTSEWKKLGDLGEVAQKMLAKKSQGTLFSKKLTVKKVVDNIRKLAEMEGSGTVSKKIALVSELLSSANAVSAKYVVRTCLEDLRTGAGFGTLRDAISKAFNVDKKVIQVAYDQTTDIGRVAAAAASKGEKGLKSFGISVGHPVKVMLFQKAKDMEDAFRIVGKPAVLEYKYDGFRLQVHRKGSKINLFTRRLEDVTTQFPDIKSKIARDIKADNYIVDCEVIGYDPETKIWRPFQEISQRIRRKYGINEMVDRLPVMVVAFDLIYLGGKSLIDKPFSERRKLLKKIIKEDPLHVSLAKEVVTSSTKEADKFYSEALSMGAEGIMVKNLEGPYKPGSRVGYGVKVKPVMETLDLAIVGAEWGTGKRATWLSSFVLACRGKKGEFLTIGKMGTGIKEKEEQGLSFKQLTRLLKPLVTSEKGRTVEIKPTYVIEVAYEEIQKSPNYKSGYALRFPRLVRMREDRHPKDADNLTRIEDLYKSQRGRKS